MIRLFGRWMGVVLVLSLSFSAATLVMTAQASPNLQQPRPLVVDTPVQDKFDASITEHSWVFDGKAGDIVMIDMRAALNSDLDPYLTLLAPDGSPLLTDDDGAPGVNARLGPYTLPSEGTYSVTASAFAGTGKYTLELRLLNAPPAIEIGTPVSGTVNSGHPLDYFLLSGESEDNPLRIVVQSGEDYLPPVIDLYGPEGLVASSEYLDDPDLNPVTVKPDTNYTLVVNWDGISCGGSYELSVEASDTVLLTPGTPQTFELAADMEVGTHYFQGEAGQRVHLSISSADLMIGLDVTILSDGIYLFSGGSEYTRALTADIEVPITGLYTIDVYDSSYPTTPVSGSYMLMLENIGE